MFCCICMIEWPLGWYIILNLYKWKGNQSGILLQKYKACNHLLLFVPLCPVISLSELHLVLLFHRQCPEPFHPHLFVNVELPKCAFCEGIIWCFISHYSKNKKHTNFCTCLNFYNNQKLCTKKPERRNLYKQKLSHFDDFERKVAIAQNASSKKPSILKTLRVTMAIFISF